jgi:ribosomal protein S3
MGQKVHPTGIRLGIVKRHTSVWYAGGKDYARYLLEDMEVRELVKKKLAAASVSRVEIERPAQTARITVYTARPGIVIGKKGEDVEKLRADIDYATSEALTTFGIIGVKVWIFKGEILNVDEALSGDKKKAQQQQ